MANSKSKPLLWMLILALMGGGSFVLYRKWVKLKEEEAARSKPVLFINKFEQALKELKAIDLKVGSGAEAIRGKKVTIHYIGRLPDGKVFDSSVERKQPTSFPLGVAQALPGWDHGIVGMKVGGKRKLLVPPFLAYGEAGVGNVVPPNSTVEFEIELLKVGEADDPQTLKNRAFEKAEVARVAKMKPVDYQKLKGAQRVAHPVAQGKSAVQAQSKVQSKLQPKTLPKARPAPSPSPQKKKKKHKGQADS